MEQKRRRYKEPELRSFPFANKEPTSRRIRNSLEKSLCAQPKPQQNQGKHQTFGKTTQRFGHLFPFKR